MKCRPVAVVLIALFSGFAQSQIADPAAVTRSRTVPQPASAKDADPVDLGTGLYVRNNLDLYLKDSIPIEFNRVYRNADPRSRAFGIGSSNAYEMFIAGDSAAFTYVELILADGSRLHYNRISPGLRSRDHRRRSQWSDCRQRERGHRSRRAGQVNVSRRMSQRFRRAFHRPPHGERLSEALSTHDR